MSYSTMAEHPNAHRGVPDEVVLFQLLQIPVGRSGVAGCRGSGWDSTAWSPHGNGRCIGPGTIVKRVSEDQYLVGCVRPTVDASTAAVRIAANHRYH